MISFFELNSYISGLQGVKCGIYGANSAEWIMSMEVHFILNFFRLGFLLNFSNSNPCFVPLSFSCCLIDSCLPLKVLFCGFNPLQAAWNWGKVPYCAIQPICEALYFFSSKYWVSSMDLESRDTIHVMHSHLESYFRFKSPKKYPKSCSSWTTPACTTKVLKFYICSSTESVRCNVSVQSIVSNFFPRVSLNILVNVIVEALQPVIGFDGAKTEIDCYRTSHFHDINL